MIKLKELKLISNREALGKLPEGKLLINTINAFSFNNARKDTLFTEALLKGDALIPDGASIVKACRWVKNPNPPTERVAGWDLFEFEMNRLSERNNNIENNANLSNGNVGAKVLFVGSSEEVLNKIRERCAKDFPTLFVDTYSPPYKPEFSDEDSQKIIDVINASNPDLLWIGMTAPKQEKWTYSHWSQLNIRCHCGTIGAVFDFYAGTVKRAPQFMQRHGLEWLYRLCMEPRRMWRRYIIGNTKFLWYTFKEM